MNVKLHSTTKIVEINGVPARVWEGITEGGIECHAYITRIAVDKKDNAAEFEKDLQEHAAPSVAIQHIPLRMII